MLHQFELASDSFTQGTTMSGTDQASTGSLDSIHIHHFGNPYAPDPRRDPKPRPPKPDPEPPHPRSDELDRDSLLDLETAGTDSLTEPAHGDSIYNSTSNHHSLLGYSEEDGTAYANSQPGQVLSQQGTSLSSIGSSTHFG